MAISEKQLDELKKELDNCSRPLFFFHDDPDGLCSFLLFYRYKKAGKGIVLKATKLDEKYLSAVENYSPDKVFILDIPVVEQNFFDGVECECIWVDHHEPLDRKNVKKFNPRIENNKDKQPVTYWCYKTVKDDMWIAMTGCVGDWFVPEFLSEFKKDYPELVDDYKKPDELLFKAEIGKLARIFAFILKGKTMEVMKCVKILTRIQGPYELLKKETPAAKLVYKIYEYAEKKYEKLLKKALEQKNEGNWVIFEYLDDGMSLTGDLSNELLFRFPNKNILIARQKSGEMKCSFRSKHNILEIVKKAIDGFDGHCGGHENACGASVKIKDFKAFTEKLTSLS